MGKITAESIRSRIKHGSIVIEKRTGELISRPLVEPIEDSRLENIEGSVLDLTINALSVRKKGFADDAIRAFIGIGERIVPAREYLNTSEVTISKYEKGALITTKASDSWTLRPWVYYIAVTREKVNIPLDWAARFDKKTTTMRDEILVEVTWGHPNYQGTPAFGIMNVGDCDAYIQRGARIISAHFFEFKMLDEIANKMDWSEVIKLVDPYGYKEGFGQWQGGKVTTDGESIGEH